MGIYWASKLQILSEPNADILITDKRSRTVTLQAHIHAHTHARTQARMHARMHAHTVFYVFWRCVSGLGGLLRLSQTSGHALMRSRSSEVGVGLALGKGHMGLTIKDECKPIPVEKTPKKTSPCTC